MCCKVYQFFDGKDYFKEIYNEKKMKNIIIYIILDIDRKYIEFVCCSVSILFEEDVAFKKGDVSTKQFGWWDECNKFVVFYFIIYIYIN